MINKGVLFLVAVGGLVMAAGCSSDGSATPAPAAATAAATALPAGITPEVLARGRAIYKANCVACHGETGKGDGPGAGVLKPPPRDHTDYAYMSTLTDKNIADVIRMGGAIKGRPLMPSHPQINGGDLDALVAYVRSLSEKK